MSDLLTKARDFLTGGDGWHGRLATAYAAVDAAETARAMHTTLEGILQAVDSMESLLHDIRGPISVPVREAQGAPAPHDGATNPGEGSRERGGSTKDPPDAPATPQEGEVWEDTKDGEMVEVLEGPPYDGAYPCHRIGSPWTDPIYRPVLNGDWRRVSPAPAPLTEREVTAEAQGVKPASDEAAWEQEVRYWCQRALDAEARAEKAEGQVARMKPVLVATDRFEKGDVSWQLFSAKVRAYREATRDA